MKRPSHAIPRALSGSFIAVVAAALGLAIAGVAQAQPKSGMFKSGSGPDELWEVTTKMEIPGMPMAMTPQTNQVCLKKDHKPSDAIPKQGECSMTNLTTVANRTTYTMVCTGANPMTATGDVTRTPTAYDGTTRIKSTRRGQEMEMTQVYSGRKVGACTNP
jgi:hypothetical protein